MKGFGLIHVYCGNGKGKTTAAIGLAVRCAGRDNKVLLVQFLKSKHTGELASLALLPQIEILRGKESNKFTFQMTTGEKALLKDEHERLFEQAVSKVAQGNYQLVIFDEIIGAIANNVFDEEQLLRFIADRPEGLEIVLTGRNPDSKLLALADYVSEINAVKHPMTKGIAARDGIER